MTYQKSIFIIIYKQRCRGRYITGPATCQIKAPIFSGCFYFENLWTWARGVMAARHLRQVVDAGSIPAGSKPTGPAQRGAGLS